ncbi:MAG: redoxin domain-containing protein [Phycisphaerales bacterium]
MKALFCAAVSSLSLLSAPMTSPAAAMSAEEIGIGDPAPPLYISEWLKGDPVDGFEQGRVYVVEFWATWCGPCIAGMPHISELQAQYKDEVTVIGVNIWDDDGSHVPAWMDERGDELMQYTVALQEGTKMADEWMKPAGQNGIPSAFIIDRDATIAWIGHPMSMDEPLAQVVAGTFDAEAAAREQARIRAERERAMREQRAFLDRAGEDLERVRNSEGRSKLRAIEDVLAMDPPEQFALSYFMTGMETALGEMGDVEAARGFFDRHKEIVWDSRNMLNSLSWQILTSPDYEGHRDADLALEIGLRAHELAEGKDAAIADTVARAYFLKAIEIQKGAVEMSDASMRTSLENQLEIYEQAYSEQPEG